VLFATALVLVGYGADSLANGRPLGELFDASRLLPAEFLFWMWLYGLVAAVSYGVRTREDVRKHREAATQAEALAADARLAALSAQLNPHFLFNALHGVSALIRRDAREAERAIERLGSLLRYSLDGGGEPEVRLEDEWRFTSTYLDLEKMGLGDRLRVATALDDEALEAHVPSFALQALVENAVRHGIAPKPAGGTVTIRATTADGRLRIDVEDDGSEAPILDGQAGTGLPNLRGRLKALYGDQAHLEITARPGGGVHARLEIPSR
jgi:LytS/YehU family sensor histidine kinase